MFPRRAKRLNITSPDGFSVIETNPWYKDKLGIVQSYIKAYHQRFDLRNKTKLLLYIGAGTGLVKIANSDTPIPGTPLEILRNQESFQRYIFCEKNPEFAKALKVRLGKFHPEKHSIVVEGDINETIDKLSPYLPEKMAGHPTSILCIIDMQSFDLNFETMELLSAMDADLILINSYLHSDYFSYSFYLDEEREQLNAYFGSSWAKFIEGPNLKSDTSFFMLVVKAYQEKVRHLGYNISSTLHKYNIEDAPVPYYQIAYCTKSKVLKSVKQNMVQEAIKQTELFG